VNFFGNDASLNTLRFSETQSFRLCTQGLRALEQYEKSASKEDLDRAEERLGQCVELYPSDALPKFYLGSAKILKGYAGLEEAQDLFNQVIRQGDPALSFAAKYNLAVVHVERYKDADFSEAERLLRDLIVAKPRRRSSEKTIWSAQATLLYIRADRLWRKRNESARKREDPVNDDNLAHASSLEKDLDEFKNRLEKSRFRSDRDVLTDLWNARGTLLEFLAYAAKDEQARIEAAKAARGAFETAADQHVDYVNSMSNLARLEGDVFHRYSEARKIWERLLTMGKSGEYIQYNLGKISEAEGKKEEALKHYKDAAPEIDSAQIAFERLSQEMKAQ
jgi:hypothetical protein